MLLNDLERTMLSLNCSNGMLPPIVNRQVLLICLQVFPQNSLRVYPEKEFNRFEKVFLPIQNWKADQEKALIGSY